jgi:hypothetical protein
LNREFFAFNALDEILLEEKYGLPVDFNTQDRVETRPITIPGRYVIVLGI